MLSATATTAPPSTVTPLQRSVGVERAAWTFYVIAALGSSIGQIWVGVEKPPWPESVPVWVRALLVLPFAIVIDLGGAVTAAFADTRRRLGETAYGWRLLSAASVTLAVGINLIGHAGSPYLATVFGGLGVFAYCVWLLHSAARRRDALRASSMLRTTAPAYGLIQWKREPAITWRARALAIDHGYGLQQSLTVARTQIADEARRAALAGHIEAKIRARHEHDPVLAAIAATTTPIDEVAQQLMDMIDAHGWATVINSQIQPPAARHQSDDGHPIVDNDGAVSDGDSTEADEDDNMEGKTDQLDGPTADLAAMLPTKPTAYQRWRAMWIELSERPNATNKQLADDLDTSVRTVQRIRAVGAAGLLTSPQPPTAKLLRLAAANGTPHHESIR